ncbi:MAG TPA: phenylphosphate carboxylase subunit delta, partial [Planctomycetes bacterium]|nr:phenylphosphate carboxylase subunit delta [Planctomycetota bacterium]
DDQIAYMGDDLLDLCLLTRVGLALTVPEARPEVKEVCHYVTRAPGGRGAVREVVELLLKAQGKWEKIVAGYRI